MLTTTQRGSSLSTHQDFIPTTPHVGLQPLTTCLSSLSRCYSITTVAWKHLCLPQSQLSPPHLLSSFSSHPPPLSHSPLPSTSSHFRLNGVSSCNPVCFLISATTSLTDRVGLSWKRHSFLRRGGRGGEGREERREDE